MVGNGEGSLEHPLDRWLRELGITPLGFKLDDPQPGMLIIDDPHEGEPTKKQIELVNTWVNIVIGNSMEPNNETEDGITFTPE